MERRLRSPQNNSEPHRVTSQVAIGTVQRLVARSTLADRLQRVGDYLRFHGSVPTRLDEFAILITDADGLRPDAFFSGPALRLASAAKMESVASFPRALAAS